MISIISVVNYKKRESLEKLLLESTRNIDAQKIIVDNNSKTENLEELAKENGWEYILNLKKQKTATALNQGIRQAREKIILIADPDTYFPKNKIQNLAERLTDKEVGVIGGQMNEQQAWTYQYNNKAPKLKAYKKDKEVFEKYAKEMKEKFGEEEKETRVTGSAMAFRKEVWSEVNGFDEKLREGFFEDTDFVSKIIKKGYKSIVKKGEFIHHGGYEGTSRTIFQGLGIGIKLLTSAINNFMIYGYRHGYSHVTKHLVKGIYGSITGYKTISEEIK